MSDAPGAGPPQPDPDARISLQRMYSGNHLDDTSHYMYHPGSDEIPPAASEGDASTCHEEDIRRREGTDVSVENVDGVQTERDIENTADLEKLKSTISKTSAREQNLVCWEGLDDPQNPKNWSWKRKWAATLVVSAFTFISPISSTMVAPALNAIGSDLHITSEIELTLTLSIFVLAYAVGPLILGPMSEVYGRCVVLQLSNLFYLFFNLGCGLARTKGEMIAFRFLAGLGGSAPLAIGGGVLSDLFTAEERGKAISIYSLAPLLGPAVGPIVGGFISENTTWRWVFYATTIADGVIQVLGFLFLQETYPPVLLGRKKLAMQKSTGNTALYTEYDHPKRTLAEVLKTSVARPFRLLGTQIIIQVLAIYMAYLYGMMYLVLASFPALWEDMYHESVGIGGLNYISLGVGFFLGTQICAPTQDKIYRVLKARNNGVGRPEFRCILMFPGAFLVPVGLFWYGWSAQARAHWILPNIGAAIYAAGNVICFQCIQTYIVDSYTRYAASAIAAAGFLRSLAGFGFPLFASYMYATLHYGWGNSLVAFIAILLGWPAPFLLWKFGAGLRAKSTFAAG